MIFGGEYVSGIDLVDIALWLFTIFFFGLVFYLHRESHREGYPVESDETGKSENGGIFWMPPAKTYLLPNDRGTTSVPPGAVDTRELAMKRVANWAGAPYDPTGNPMADAVGPASYTERDDVPDLITDGRLRIVPYRAGDGYEVAKSDADPRGMTVYGGDGEPGGTVVDLWVDRAEAIIRYLEVNAGSEENPHHVLLPVPFANVKKDRVNVFAIFGEHFKLVPQLKDPDSVTRLEEDKISGFYGGGTFYASPARSKPFV